MGNKLIVRKVQTVFLTPVNLCLKIGREEIFLYIITKSLPSICIPAATPLSP